MVLPFLRAARGRPLGSGRVAANGMGRQGPSLLGPRVGLFGRLGSGNLGNDGTLEAVLAYLRTEQPRAVLDAMCSGPETVRSRYGLPAGHLHWHHSSPRRAARRAPRATALAATCLRVGSGVVVDAWQTAAWVRRHEVVIVPGMGTLEATLRERPWQMPYSLFLLSASGRMFGTKVALVGVGATDLPQWLTRWLMTTAASLAHYRSFRDEYSRDAMRRMGLNALDEVYPDLVFAIPTPEVGPTPDVRPTPEGRQDHQNAASIPTPHRTVGVGVMAYFGTNLDRDRAGTIHEDYVAKMAGFVRWLVDSGREVRLFIGDADDAPVARAVRDQVGRQRPDLAGSVRFDPCASLEELMHAMQAVDIVVASRYHNVLCALKCGRPTLSVGYGVKHDELMDQMGMAGHSQGIADLDLGRLIEQFEALERDREGVGRALTERNGANVHRLERQFADLSAVLFPVRVDGVVSPPRWPPR